MVWYTFRLEDRIVLMDMVRDSTAPVVPMWMPLDMARKLADEIYHLLDLNPPPSVEVSYRPDLEAENKQLKHEIEVLTREPLKPTVMDTGAWGPPSNVVDRLPDEPEFLLCDQPGDDKVVNGSDLSHDAKKRRSRYLHGVSRAIWPHKDRTIALVREVMRRAPSPFNSMAAIARRANVSDPVINRLLSNPKRTITTGYAEAIERACYDILVSECHSTPSNGRDSGQEARPV